MMTINDIISKSIVEAAKFSKGDITIDFDIAIIPDGKFIVIDGKITSDVEWRVVVDPSPGQHSSRMRFSITI
jgi:hypothetical protein